MRLWKPLVISAVTAVTVVASATNASAGNGTVNYTHRSALNQTSCMIHANYPKAGIPDWGWTKQQRSPRGTRAHVGVRYTYKDYALVLDHAKKNEPSWGFIAKSCLVDPHAYDAQGNRLPDLRAIGGNGKTKDVPISAPHAGKTKRTLLHVGAGEVGTIRSAGKSFAIGNVRAGDPFYITTEHCGTHNPDAWKLGYAPNSGRWGYVQARHLPACH